MRKTRINRRTLLSGAGVVVGLPVLECMLDSKGTAYAQGGGFPPRYGIVFAGQALGGDDHENNLSRINGELTTREGDFIVPPQTGSSYDITTPLRPLADLLSDFSLVSGMRIPYNESSTEPADVPAAGAYRDFHGGGSGPLLCGTRSLEPTFTCRSITSDQVIAGLNQGQTALDSIVLRAQPSFYLAGYTFAGRHRISYRGDADPIEAQDSPQTAYQSIFGSFQPDDAEALAQFDFDRRARRSVLDLITQKRERLLARVSYADRVRLERHFDEIRNLETRIDALQAATGECQLPGDPGNDPPVGGDNAGAGSDSIATNTGYSDEATRTRVMADLIHMAFVCDLSRAATLQITAFQSHMNVYPITGDLDSPVALNRAFLADLHEVGHNGDADFRGQLAVSLCLQWHIAHYAYLLQKMKDTPEGDGTLLDNSVLIFMPEAGHGRHLNSPEDTEPKTHSVENMVLLVGGRAGGLAPGRHIATDGAHPGQCLLSCMNAAGYAGTTFGEVEADLPELFG
ncbi:MAG TPA: DUF1552 domain-containing protein [Polyangiaceae bacterium]|nr:DUF1552 domain-containing protein [Polyangiaceae bacterium]